MAAPTSTCATPRAREEYPGDDSDGDVAVVLQDLRSRGEASVTLDGEAGDRGHDVHTSWHDAGGRLQGRGEGLSDGLRQPEARGTETAAVPPDRERRPRVLAGLARQGPLRRGRRGCRRRVGHLDDPDNPLSLRFAFGREQLRSCGSSSRWRTRRKTLEAVLTDNKRAVLYGIYFDFNSATIKLAVRGGAAHDRRRHEEGS